MRLFFFAIGARERASSRLRVWDHLAWASGLGYDVVADSQVEPGVVRSGPRVVWRMLRKYPVWLALAWKADIVLVQESLILAPLTRFKNVGHARRIIFDFSDPVDSVGDGFRARIRRWLFGMMVRHADAVMMENRAYLGRLAASGVSLHHFYGPVDAERYGDARQRHDKQACATSDDRNRRLRLCWTGSPGTFEFIEPLLPVLEELSRSEELELVLIGAPKRDLPLEHLIVEAHDWDEASEFGIVASCDIGLFRLPPGPAGALRGAGKLFIYLAAGLLPVASARGISADVMSEAGVGVGIDDDARWAEGLRLAIKTADRREKSRQARAFARESLSYDAYRRQLQLLFSDG